MTNLVIFVCVFLRFRNDSSHVSKHSFNKKWPCDVDQMLKKCFNTSLPKGTQASLALIYETCWSKQDPLSCFCFKICWIFITCSAFISELALSWQERRRRKLLSNQGDELVSQFRLPGGRDRPFYFGLPSFGYMYVCGLFCKAMEPFLPLWLPLMPSFPLTHSVFY